MKFEELSEERQQEILNEKRETNVDYTWWDSELEHICDEVKEKVDIEISPQLLGFDFFSKGNSGLWINGGELSNAVRNKHWQLEDLEISEQFGVWAYIGLRQDELEDDDIDLYEEDREDDLAALIQEKEDEKIKEEIQEDVGKILDIFSNGYRSLEDEYDYLTSDKGIIEMIENNDEEFENED